MDFDGFTGQVQNRLELASSGESLRGIRATLTTLGERIQEGEATDLAGALPMEIDFYLTGAVSEHGQHFDWNEFLERVWEREEMTDSDERADAAYHARVIIDIVNDAVPPGEMQDVRDGLPESEDWDELFELVDQDDQEEREN